MILREYCKRGHRRTIKNSRIITRPRKSGTYICYECRSCIAERAREYRKQRKMSGEARA